MERIISKKAHSRREVHRIKSNVETGGFFTTYPELMQAKRLASSYCVKAQVSEKLADEMARLAADYRMNGDQAKAWQCLNVGLQANPWSSSLHYMRAEMLDARLRDKDSISLKKMEYLAVESPKESRKARHTR